MKLFLEGAMWAGVNSLPPVGIAIANYWHRRQRVDWEEVGPLLAATIITALVAYWRKYKALIALQPK